MADKKQEVKTYVTAEGRLINSSLFERDIFKSEAGGEAKPAYRVEMAFEAGQLDELLDAAFAEATKAFGDVQLDIDDGEIQTPIKAGDELAAARAAKSKPGDAYKGKVVLRASTQYAKNGEMGPGGISVYAPDTSEIGIMAKEQVYNGCYGKVGVSIGTYTVNKTRGVKFYLKAFQKTREGERLASVADHSTLFKPVGRVEGAPATGRRVRAG